VYINKKRGGAEVKVYLVQHGLSMPEEMDPEKALSPEGNKQSRNMAEFLKEKNIRVDSIWHSPKKRAVQTAHIMAEILACPETQERKGLNPLDPVGNLPGEIKSLNKDLMIVGHLPFLQKLASFLLSGTEDNQFISIRNSGVICLEYTDSWKLLWTVVPELLEKEREPTEFDSSKFGC
jgi:phosphohistidine phosphatase